jgi:hypothetical protein
MMKTHRKTNTSKNNTAAAGALPAEVLQQAWLPWKTVRRRAKLGGCAASRPSRTTHQTKK